MTPRDHPRAPTGPHRYATTTHGVGADMGREFRVMLPVETLASELVDKIEEAGDGYSIRLTRLVDGEAEYTLFYDGVETTHSSHEEAADYFQSIIHKEKIEIAAEAIAAWNTRPTSSAEDEVAVPTVRETYASWQQKRGMLADKVDWAINEYDEFMKDDAYDAQRVLDRIIERLRDTRQALGSADNG